TSSRSWSRIPVRASSDRCILYAEPAFDAGFGVVFAKKAFFSWFLGVYALLYSVFLSIMGIRVVRK
ncbi:MAG: hypothetical protein SOR74_04825, partial [Candidatus Faecivicinus sp.]|nr:hypothetical protein [Candidatus Faecivicinus sp.]